MLIQFLEWWELRAQLKDLQKTQQVVTLRHGVDEDFLLCRVKRVHWTFVTVDALSGDGETWESRDSIGIRDISVIVEDSIGRARARLESQFREPGPENHTLYPAFTGSATETIDWDAFDDDDLDDDFDDGGDRVA